MEIPGKWIVPLVAIAATLYSGCAAQVETSEPLETLPPRPLPFTLHFSAGDRNHLPASLANTLNDSSVLELSYAEKVTDQNSPVPALLSMLDPFVMVGVPLGTYTVHASATCSITIRGRVVKSYLAESTVSRSYGLYHGSSFPELEKEAREAVEHQIEQSVYRDADQIALAAKADHATGGSLK